MDIKIIDAAYVAGTYKRFPVQIVSGKGSVVLDETGKTIEWERLEISSRKLEIPREHFMQRWVQ